MAFPSELKQFANEDDFIQRFLVPLLKRLGFGLVTNYHGNTEFGKDLVFGEIDRFGNIRYHGLQAKYEASIGLEGSQTLISDCHQAFANPFKHPQTGATEHISSFYAVNGGSLSTQAVDHFFASVRPTRGPNVYLLQGKDLLVLDRLYSITSVQEIRARVTGLLFEISYNNTICNVILGTFEKRLGEKHVIPLERLRVAAVGGFLTQPVLSNPDLINDVSAALHHATTINALNESMLRFAVGGEDIDEKKAQVAEMIRELAKVTARIDSRVWTLMAGLGPLVGP